ncbi:Adenosine monophosphate-protein transferase VbhT [Mycobacterium attenuatum]|nr:Adenosine monophosphate-protein transferase VbhT [Mycobacterium attenuatum]
MSARHVAIQCVSRSSTVDPGVSSSHAPAGLRRRSCIVQDSLDPDSRGARHVTRRDPLRPTAWGVVAPLRRSRTERDELRVLAGMVAVPANSHDGFCPPGSISRPVEHVAAQIFHLDRLGAVDEGDLAGKVAYVSDYVNYAHPLREGNGRCTREFFNLLLSERGSGLDWWKTDLEELHGACHAAHANSHLTGLVAMFTKILDAEPAYDF